MNDAMKILIDAYPGARPDGGSDDLLEWASSAKALLEDAATWRDDAHLSELHARLRQALGAESVEEAFDEIENLMASRSELLVQRDNLMDKLRDAEARADALEFQLAELEEIHDGVLDVLDGAARPARRDWNKASGESRFALTLLDAAEAGTLGPSRDELKEMAREYFRALDAVSYDDERAAARTELQEAEDQLRRAAWED